LVYWVLGSLSAGVSLVLFVIFAAGIVLSVKRARSDGRFKYSAWFFSILLLLAVVEPVINTLLPVLVYQKLRLPIISLSRALAVLRVFTSGLRVVAYVLLLMTLFTDPPAKSSQDAEAK